MNKLKVNVTCKHIEAGIKLNVGKCPIALALIEAFRALDDKNNARWISVIVDSSEVTIERDKRLDEIWALPDSASRFISRFDAGKPVKPFTFSMKRRSENDDH